MENKKIESKKGFRLIGKPWRSLPWQITTCLDKFGNKRIQIKYYRQRKEGGWDFFKQQIIYAKPKDWKELKKKIKGK